MRRRNGQSLIEVTVGIVIFVPIFLVLFDLSVILFAVQQNESVCRNAVQIICGSDVRVGGGETSGKLQLRSTAITAGASASDM
jgi:hypothetical protein